MKLIFLLIVLVTCASSVTSSTSTNKASKLTTTEDDDEGGGFQLDTMEKAKLNVNDFPEDDPKVQGVKRTEDVGAKVAAFTNKSTNELLRI